MIKEKMVIKAQWLKTSTQDTNRNLGLDIARTICIVVIIGLHTNNYMRPFFGGYGYLFPIGYIAQDLLFALSGFLVGKQILKYVNSSANPIGLLKFYKNRWLRIVPLYWVFLIINTVLFYAVYQHTSLNFFYQVKFNFTKYVFFFQNFAWPHPGFFPEVWPLAIEEWSFLLLPLPVYAAVKLFKNPLSQKQIIVLIVVEILIVSLFRINYVLKHNPETDWGLRKIVIYRLDALLYGFLTLLVVQNSTSFFIKNKKSLLLIGVVGSLLIYYVGIKLHPLLFKSLLFTAVPACCSIALTYFYFTDFALLSTKIKALATHISLISYSLLLTHLYFLQFSLLSFFKPENLVQALGFTLIYFTLLGLIATLIFNYIERPLLLKRNN
jgi:peptidoglycan/LPS O-acetylase OafA/YrhL